MACSKAHAGRGAIHPAEVEAERAHHSIHRPSDGGIRLGAYDQTLTRRWLVLRFTVSQRTTRTMSLRLPRVAETSTESHSLRHLGLGATQPDRRAATSARSIASRSRIWPDS